MPLPINHETAPNTAAFVDTSFRSLLQEASGHGRALEIEVNHAALIEAAADAGFAGDTSLTFAFLAQDDKAHLTATQDKAAQVYCIIDSEEDPFTTPEDAQSAIQAGVLHNLRHLAKHAQANSDPLIDKSKLPLLRRAMQRAKVLGGTAVSIVSSTAILETVAAGSPTIVKLLSVGAIARKTYTSLDFDISIMGSTEEGLIGGYPPFINFKINSDNK